MNQQYGDIGAMRLGAVLRIARLTFRIAACFIFLVAVAGFGPSAAWAEDAATDQTAPANPALTNETCLGCHGQQGFAPARREGFFSNVVPVTSTASEGRSRRPTRPRRAVPRRC